MRAVVLTRHGGPEVLQVQERPDLAPKEGEILIRVRASGVNFADLMARLGLYPEAPPPPCVIGYEVSGDVAAVGEGVEGFAAGDRVLASTPFGGYADQVVVPGYAVHHLPEAMTFEEGAAIPVNYGTAYHMLFHVGSFKADETIFIQSIAGGVGLALVDLALHVGARRIIGVASKSKFDFLHTRGLSDLVSREEDALPAIMRMTEGRGVDLFIDSEGGPGLRQSYASLAPGGRLLMLGVSSFVSGPRRNLARAALNLLRTPRFSSLNLINDNRAVIGVSRFAFSSAAPDIYQNQLGELLAMYEAGQIRPYVDRTFSAEEAGATHQYLHDRKNRGKVVITWP